MAKTLKRIDAGGIQWVVLCDRLTGREAPVQRQAKRQVSSEAQRILNQKNSWQKLEQLLSTNFPTPGSSLWVCLPFDDAHMPKNRKEAQRRFKNFLKKLRDARKALGLTDPVVFWSFEVLTSASGRWHVHMVIDNTGIDYDMIRDCWIYGRDVDIQKMGKPVTGGESAVWYDPNTGEQGNYWKAVAKYMTKEPRECQEYDAKPGLHGWSCTRNVKRPEVETFIVPDDFQLEAPEGSIVMLDVRKKTEWASYHVIKYRFSGMGFAAAPRAKRRKKRRR